MRKKLLALFVILLAGTLSGCQLRGFIDRIRFTADVASFSAAYGDSQAYALHMRTKADVSYMQSGVRTTNSVTVTVDNEVDLADFYVDATISVDGMSTRYIIDGAEEERNAYKLVEGNRLAEFELTEADLSLLCGCEDEMASTGVVDFDDVVRNEDGSYSQTADLGDDEGLGYELANELAATIGIDRATFAGTVVTATIELDREDGTITTTVDVDGITFSEEGITFTIGVDLLMEYTFLTSVDRIDKANFFFPLPDEIADIVDTVGPNEPVSAYVGGYHHVGWIKVEVTAGGYRLDLSNTNSVNPWSISVCDAAGTILTSSYIYGYTFPADGVYLIRIESGTDSPQFTFTLIPYA